MLRTLLAGAALVLAATAASLAQDARTDVEAAYAAWDEAFNASDASGLASAYTDDALLLAPDHQVRNGPAGVEAFFGGLFESGVTGHELALIEAGGEGDTVWATANWSADGKDETGAASEIGGIATHIFERRDDGSLKLRLHTFN